MSVSKKSSSNKQCIICGEEFQPKKYCYKVTCSKKCQCILAVRTRHEKGSYKHSEEFKKTQSKRMKEILAKIDPNSFRNSSSCRIEYGEDGTIYQKECKKCGFMLPPEKFRKCDTENPHQPNCGLTTYCHECELKIKEIRRRKAGYKPQRKAKFLYNEKGEITHKDCFECNKMLPLNLFDYAGGGALQKRSRCKKCSASYSYKRKYGITIEDKEKAFQDQNGKCKLCGKEYNFDNLYIDHDHNKNTEESFRALLCSDCNWAFGALGDGKEIEPILGLLRYYCFCNSISVKEIKKLL